MAFARVLFFLDPFGFLPCFCRGSDVSPLLARFFFSGGGGVDSALAHILAGGLTPFFFFFGGG